ncbi:MAG: response regulator [Saprospiraceae bacterium]|nr:response regulator [Lewinella sp.]
MKGRILIVDDQPDFFQHLSEQLEKRDYKVDIASSIELAEKMIDDPDIFYDLLLVDLLFDGTEEQSLLFIDSLRDKGITTKIIIVTYSNSVATVFRVLKNTKIHIEDFLLKKEYDIVEWLTRIKDEIRENGNIRKHPKNVAVWKISTPVEKNRIEKPADESKVDVLTLEELCLQMESLIAQGKIEEPIELMLRQKVVPIDTEIKTHIIALSAKYNQLRKKIQDEIIKDDEIDYQMNKIIVRLVDIKHEICINIGT